MDLALGSVVSGHRRRVSTLQAIVAGSPVAGDPRALVVHGEFELVFECGRVHRLDRRWLLQIIHASRALDTTLTVFTALNGRRGRSTLGQCLVWLQNQLAPARRRLPPRERRAFQNNIVRVRNRYMHEAGALPQDVAEVTDLLDEMGACLVRVLAL